MKLIGDGCPSGSAVALASPDQATVTVAFSMFEVTMEPGRTGGVAKSCLTQIPIVVSEGFALTSSRITYRGFADLNDGVRAQLSTVYQGRDRRRPDREVADIRPSKNGDWEITQRPDGSVRSGCGTTTNLDIVTTLGLRAPRRVSSTTGSTIAMDTLDATTRIAGTPVYTPALEIGLTFVPCSGAVTRARA